VGLVGVLIIVSPQLTVFTSGAGFTDTTFGTISALLGCVFAATAMLLVRRLVATESSATIVLYFSLASSLAGLLTIPFGWVMPTPEQLVLMVSAGIAGGIAQILLTESYRHADMSVIAPFEYASLILSVGVGYIFFGDIPTIQMLIGGLIVVGSGIFIIFREHRLGVANAKAQSSNTPQ
jgi:drug/metabolite transporter (DMT)-like permease